MLGGAESVGGGTCHGLVSRASGRLRGRGVAALSLVDSGGVVTVAGVVGRGRGRPVEGGGVVRAVLSLPSMVVVLSDAGVTVGCGATLTLSAAGSGSRLLHAIAAATIATAARPRCMTPPVEVTPPPAVGLSIACSRGRGRGRSIARSRREIPLP